MGRHHALDSDFDEETESYQDGRTPRVAFRQGFLTGVIVTWVAALAGFVAYLMLTR